MELETLLRENRLPGELADLALCKFMGWSWRELMETPEQVVADARAWMRTEAAVARERTALRGR